MNLFCPKCGTTEGKFINGFCEKCYLQDHEIISMPKELELQKCPVCGKVKVFGRWEKPKPENIKKFIEAKAKVNEILEEKKEVFLSMREDGNFNVRVKVTGKIGSERIVVEDSAVLKFAKENCNSCNRIAGGYYEATIQVRWKKPENAKKRSRVLREINSALSMQKSTDSLAQIIKIEEKKNGFDARIGSNNAARLAVSRLKKKFGEKAVSSSTLVGLTRDGRKRMRFTYCFRF